MRDVYKAVIVFVAAVALALVIRECKAGEWLSSGTAYIGVQGKTSLGGDTSNPFCRDQGDEVGILGFTTDLYRAGDHAAVLSLDHQSCLQEEDDAASINWIGVRYEFRLW